MRLLGSWQNAHPQLQRTPRPPSQQLSFKSIRGPTEQNKNLRVVQKCKPSLIKTPGSRGAITLFVKSLKVRRAPVAGKVENARSCSRR